MNKKKVAYITGSRADYGIVRKYLNLIYQNEDIELDVLVTGALLDENYGKAINLIENDGFNIRYKVDIELDSTSNTKILHSMSLALDKFGTFFDNNKYDLVIVLGDRFEIFSATIAAAMNTIPILHIHGGEATFANYDEFIRHSVTKMSLYHFTATEEYRRRVIQLGENPNRVFNLGALGAENCKNIDESNVASEVRKMNKDSYFVILFHPETLTNVDVLEQTQELIKGIEAFKNDFKFVFLGSNADTNSQNIRMLIKNYVKDNKNSFYFENVNTASYHYLIKNAICLVGNSSSGIIEAPSLETYTVNIGQRQDGRVKGNSIKDVKCIRNEITSAIKNIVDNKEHESFINPYYKENTLENYYSITLKLLNELEINDIEPKRFYDIEVQV